MTSNFRETIEQNEAQKGGNSNLMLIIASLICIVSVGIGAFFTYKNIQVNGEIASKNAENEDLRSKNEALRKKPGMQAYEIIIHSSDAIETAIERSKAQKYLLELSDISTNDEIWFSGFNYTQGIITTKAESTRTSEVFSNPIDKIIALIKKHRDGTASGSLMLDKVLTVAGEDGVRSFNATFKIQ